MKKMYPLNLARFKRIALSLFSITFCFLLSANEAAAQSLSNGGFEANIVYPGTGWTGAGNMTAGSIATAGSRTGVNNLSTTFSNNQGFDSWITNGNAVTVTTGNYLHIIAWAKVSATNANTIIWLSANNTNLSANATLTAAFAQYSGNFQRTNNANSGLSGSSSQPQVGFNTYNNTSRIFNLDDVVAYTDGNANADLTAPGSASGFTNGAITSSSVTFTWTNGTDAGSPATGVQGVVVLRTTNTAAGAPTLNNQGIYSVAGGTSGPNTDQSANWNIISIGAASNGSAGSYTDNSVVAGTTYKYATINYDLAFNYSTALTSGNVVVPAATPTITSFSPASGCANTASVVITGTNLATATAVTIGGIAATITGTTSTTVTATVGSGTTGTIKVTTPAGSVTGAGTFTVNALPTATIAYGGSPYCSSAGTATVTQTGTGGGTYTAAGGLSINSSTGAVNLGASTAGTYTVTYSFSNGTCSNTTTASITVTAQPSATVSYSGSPYCSNGGTATVTRTGTAGGSYSSAGGLSINAATGAVNIGSSTTGTYTVTYSVAAAGGCGLYTTTTSITITALPAATISYSGSPYCSSGGTAAVTQTGTTGGTYSAAGGVSINSSTGAINLSASTAGTYTVTYTIAAASGCGVVTATGSVTITAQPSATISYAGTPYCATGTATVTQTGTSGGTYSAGGGLSINPATGAINLAASTAGPYTVTYTVAASGGCAIYTTTTPVTVNALPTATVAYGGSPYCSSAGTATVTQTGTGGGTYTAAGGLSINSSTGAVNLGASTAGTYTVTYSFSNGTCSNTTTASITVTAQPSATVSYSGSPYCSNGGTATVTRTGTAGGSYSSAGGLSINAATGAVNIGSSTTGTYTVTYSVAAAGGCGLYTTTTSITITALPAATISYSGSPYCSSGGTAAVTQTGTTGGTYSAAGGVSINSSTGAINLSASTAGTYTVTYTIAAASGCGVVTATGSVTITVQPSATISYAGTPYCATGTATVTQTGTSGGTYSAGGGLSINPATGAINLAASTAGPYTVTYTVAASGGCAIYTTTTPVTVNALPTATVAYGGSPYCSSAGTATVTQTGTGGGTYTAAGGLSINSSTGAVNLGASTAGTYTVTYSFSNGTCSNTTTASITVTAQPSATVSYSGSPYCSNGGTATVTRTGTAGGSYSSAGGLSINAATGAVNIGSSTTGTYTVTYSVAAAGGCGLYTTTTSITITALPAATISYSGSPYCSSGGTAAVTQTGTTGGTYSAAGGVSINSSTGAINLSASTAGTYTVTYTIAAASGCGVVTATGSVTITAQPSATISYSGSPYCSNGTTATVTATGTSGGTYSSTAGLSINAGTGTVNISSSTPGTYTVTYTVTASGGCALYTTTASITITTLPAATISYTGPSFCTSAGSVSVTQTGTGGGTYSAAPAGLSINSSTGAVNLGASTPGIYIVTYTIAAGSGCAVVTATTSLSVNALPTLTSVIGTPATICNGNSSNLVVTAPAAAATTIVNYDFNNGTSYATLTPSLATNITASASSSASFATAGGTATDGSAFTTNGTAGNGLTMVPDGIMDWIFTLGGSNLSKYTTFKFYFQAESFNFFSVPDPGSVSVAYSLNGGSFITTGLSAITLTPGAGSFASGVFTLPASANNPTTSLAIRVTPAANFFGQFWETETIDNFQVQAVSSNNYSWAASPSGATAGLPGTAGSSLTTNNNIIVLPTASTAYTVTATNVNGCQQTGNVSVTVNQKSGAPTSVTATLTTICWGSSTTLTLNGGGGGTGELIKWYTGSCGGTLVGTGNNLSVNPLVNTTYFGRYEDGAPCNYTTACASILITVTPTVGTPSTPTPSAGTICQASGPTAYTTSATNATSYNWSVTGAGNTISGTGTTATVTWAAGFTGTATVSVTANGCSGPSISASTSVTVTATVGTPSTPTTSATTICQASGPTSFTTSAANASSYNWSVTGAGNTISGTGTTATVTWSAGFSGSATVSVTANGCNPTFTTASTTITVTPTVGTPSTPTPSASTICQASGPTTFNTSATDASSYNWSVTGAGNTISGTATTATVTWAAGFNGTATVSVTANGCNGPSGSASTSVTVTPTVGTPSTPTPSASTICQASGPTTFTTSATHATTYNWSVTGAGNTISGSGTTATVTWAAGFSGTATVSVTANGCNSPSTAASTTVTVTPAPSATISYSGSPYCTTSGPATVTQTGTAGGTYTSAAGLSLDASTGTVNFAASSAGTYTVTYTVAASGGCSIYTTTASITLIANTWIGVTSSDWNDGTNWSCGTPPTATTDVTINITPHDPIVSSAIAMTHNLTIATGVSVTVTGQKLQIAGVLTNNGTFNASNGTIEMNSSAAQNIPSGAFLNNAVSDLVITNAAGVTLSGAVDVYNSLTYGMSGAILNTGGWLTLKSSSSQTAWIGDMTNHTINGNVTVERYIGTGTVTGDHAKSWQFLAIPTQGQTINQSWMEGSLAPNDNLHPGYGTQITGSGTGFDVTTSTPSMKVFNSVNNGYIGVSGSGIPIYNQKGYFIFVRGDRSVTNPFATPTPTVLRTTGTLFTPANMPPATVVNASSSESVGNPYASAIDVRNIGLTGGVTPVFTVWDPRLGSTSGYGTFQYLTQIGGNFYAVPGGTASYPGYPTPTNYIQSGQAFLAQTATGGTSGTVTFDESAKVGGNSTLFTTPNPVAQTIRLFNTTLSQVNATGTTNLVDGALAIFNDTYGNGIANLEARKSMNSAENLAILTGGKLLAVDSRPTINSNDTIFFSLSGVGARNYRLHFDAENLNPLVQGYLVDLYTNSSTALTMTGTTDVNFTVSSVAGSYAANRFMVVFAPAKVLPVTFTSITATQQGKNIDVQWRVDNEMDINQYEVEKSVNGTDFATIATATPTSNNGGSAVYVAADANPADGYNYYRVKSVDVNGAMNYSAIVKVLTGSLQQSMAIYPNPVADGMIHLQLKNQPQGYYMARLVNKLGQVIAEQPFTHAGGNSTQLIRLDHNVAHGMYDLQVSGPSNNQTTINVMY